jgi:drug/metabolite transporter (DMT)-like permease
MITAQVLFSIMSIGARLVARDVPWQEVCASRMIVAAIVAFVVAKLRGTSLAITDKRFAWLRSIFGTLSAAGTFYVFAQPGLAIGDAVTLFATSPIFVALLSWPLLGERVRASVGVAIVIAFAGILVVAKPSFATAPHVVVAGTATALGSALAMMWLRKIGPGESSEAIVFHFMSVGSVALVIASVPVWKTPDAHSVIFLGVTGLSGGLAQLAMTRAYASENAARVSALSYAQIVFVRVFALPIFGEAPTVVQIAGSLLVIASGAVLTLRARATTASDGTTRSTTSP